MARPSLRKLDLDHARVDRTHGSGGRAMAQLIEDLFEREFDNEYLGRRDDQAVLATPSGGRLAMSVDGFVISPLFFPGGDIGSLAVHGTVNDVAMAGARPLWLATAFILEEGFPLADLARIVRSMARAAREADAQVVTGDTKVVEKGKGDGVFISTTGVGEVLPGVNVSADRARPGDRILLSGTIGDHGVAILSKREGLEFGTELERDCASLHGLVGAIVEAAADRDHLHVLRDPTRGGLAAVLNEIADRSGAGLLVREEDIPVRTEVQGACELLGLDPLYVANEGKLVAFVHPDAAPAVLAAMRAHPLGAGTADIGEVVADENRFVRMKTPFGGHRMVDWLSGEQLPRIC